MFPLATRAAEGETDDSQELKRKWLADELPKARDERKVEECMSLTYASQRLCINSASGSLKDAKEKWGFLFEKKMLVKETLRNISLSSIYRQLEARALVVHEFAKHKFGAFSEKKVGKNPDVDELLNAVAKAREQQNSNLPCCDALVPLVMCLLGEKLESLIKWTSAGVRTPFNRFFIISQNWPNMNLAIMTAVF